MSTNAGWSAAGSRPRAQAPRPRPAGDALAADGTTMSREQCHEARDWASIGAATRNGLWDRRNRRCSLAADSSSLSASSCRSWRRRRPTPVVVGCGTAHGNRANRGSCVTAPPTPLRSGRPRCRPFLPHRSRRFPRPSIHRPGPANAGKRTSATARDSASGKPCVAEASPRVRHHRAAMSGTITVVPGREITERIERETGPPRRATMRAHR